MKVGIPREVKNHEYRVAITPAGRARARPQRPRGLRRVRRRASARRSPTRSSPRRARRSCPPPTTCGRPADLVLKVKEPIAEEYHRMRDGPGAVHLPAPGRVQGVHRRAARPQGHRHRVRDGRDCPTARCRCWRRCSEVAGRLAPQVGAYHLMRSGRRPRRADGRRVRRVRGQGRRDRRRRVRHERGRDRAGHAGRGAAAGQEHRTSCAQADAHLPGPPADRRLQRVRDRAGRARRRPGDRRGAGARRQGAEAGHQRAGLADEAGQRARRHLDRPGRLLRGLPADHARRPDLPGAQQSCSTAWRTCPARCRTPPRTR